MKKFLIVLSVMCAFALPATADEQDESKPGVLMSNLELVATFESIKNDLNEYLKLYPSENEAFAALASDQRLEMVRLVSRANLNLSLVSLDLNAAGVSFGETGGNSLTNGCLEKPRLEHLLSTAVLKRIDEVVKREPKEQTEESTTQFRHLISGKSGYISLIRDLKNNLERICLANGG